MIYNRTGKLQIIHIAKRECGLTDEEYRQLLEGAAGITSASDLKSEQQFDKIMKAFGKLGFHSNRPRQTRRRKHENRWGCSDRQRSYIEGLWRLMSRRKDLDSLESMIKRIAKVEHPAGEPAPDEPSGSGEHSPASAHVEQSGGAPF